MKGINLDGTLHSSVTRDELILIFSEQRRRIQELQERCNELAEEANVNGARAARYRDRWHTLRAKVRRMSNALAALKVE